MGISNELGTLQSDSRSQTKRRSRTVYYRIENISKHEDSLSRAVALMEIVNGLRLLGRYEEAFNKIDQACTLLGPNHEQYPEAAFLAAAINMDVGNWKAALSQLDALLKKYPPIVRMPDNKEFMNEIQRNRGMALTNLKEFAQAAPVLESVRSAEQGRQETLCYLGMCNFELGRLEASQGDFEELLSLAPNCPLRAYAHYYLGMIRFQKGQLAWAKQHFGQSLACPERARLSEATLLNWLIKSSESLQLVDDVARYTAMLKNVRQGGG